MASMVLETGQPLMTKCGIKILAFVGLTVGLLFLGVGVLKFLAPTTDEGRDRL